MLRQEEERGHLADRVVCSFHSNPARCQRERRPELLTCPHCGYEDGRSERLPACSTSQGLQACSTRAAAPSLLSHILSGGGEIIFTLAMHHELDSPTSAVPEGLVVLLLLSIRVLGKGEGRGRGRGASQHLSLLRLVLERVQKLLRVHRVSDFSSALLARSRSTSRDKVQLAPCGWTCTFEHHEEQKEMRWAARPETSSLTLSRLKPVLSSSSFTKAVRSVLVRLPQPWTCRSRNEALLVQLMMNYPPGLKTRAASAKTWRGNCR